MFNLDRIDISQFIYFYFNCAINCLNMNRVTICRAKCLGIVTLKVLWTSCSRFNSGEKSPKFMIPKKELLRVSPCKFFNKMFGGFRENDRFLKNLFVYLSQKVYTFISIPHKMLWWWLKLKGQLLSNVSSKETEGVIHSTPACLINIWKIIKIYLPLFPIQIWLT